MDSGVGRSGLLRGCEAVAARVVYWQDQQLAAL